MRIPQGAVQLVAACTVLALTSSCLFVVPKDRAREKSRHEEVGPYRAVGPETVNVQRRANGTVLEVHAVWEWVCERPRTLTVETVTHTGATVKVFVPCDDGSSGCGFMTIVALVYSPVTLLISGLITLGVVASADDRVARQMYPVPPSREVCTRPADGVSLWISVPGRGPTTAVTDAAGLARVDLGDPAAPMQAQIQVVQQ